MPLKRTALATGGPQPGTSGAVSPSVSCAPELKAINQFTLERVKNAAWGVWCRIRTLTALVRVDHLAFSCNLFRIFGTFELTLAIITFTHVATISKIIILPFIFEVNFPVNQIETAGKTSRHL